MPTVSYFSEIPLQPPSHRPGWVRFLDLEAHFQLFLIEAMADHAVTAKEFDGEVYLPAEFVHRFTEHDIDWSRPLGRGDLPVDALHGWYPFDQLSPFGQTQMTAVAMDPRNLGVCAGRLFVSKTELENYVAGEDSEIRDRPSNAELQALAAASAGARPFSC